jgi:aminopeptidase N
MKRFLFLVFHCSLIIFSSAQTTEQPSPKEYRATAEKINDLAHTRLEAKFDYTKSYLYGKAWLTLKPHFYPTDSVLLDAKGMEIKQVALVKNGKNSPVKFNYIADSFLNITLDRAYKANESYTVYIDYTAKPNEFESKGSAAITNAKGLYFINPLGQDKNKPTQIWTQGETESTSVWIPTIDKPNQKTTQEFYLSVPAKYVTLSNGKLMSQKTNSDGTRTDYWKMDLPHAPYLFFIGVGDYAIIKDQYKGKEVSYYVEKEYAPVARKIFGHTPEMIAYFSKILGVEYPWVKYSQMTARDYISGAMENTTATLHQESAQQDARQLADENKWENTIAHELFHQWFGDLVTTESWSNLTVNESFANYSEYLWNEYKYGKDAADEHNYSEMEGYITSKSENKKLVRFYYKDKEDMFDAVSYNKGGNILNMLRKYVGDTAFFKSLNLYINANKFKSAEAQQLRLSFEEITGKDLNWFWNQWYYGSGHPELNITYGYDNARKMASVIVQQKQETGTQIFKLPVAIDVYSGTNRTRYNVWVDDRIDTFYFPAASKPDLINFDAEKALLAMTEENKTLDEYLFQYKNARNYVDRREAVDAALAKQDEQKAIDILMLALNDPFAGLRQQVAEGLDLKKIKVATPAEPILASLAQNDKSRKTKAAAIAQLGEYESPKYKGIFQATVNDSSYTVSGNALEALFRIDPTQALTEAKRLSTQPAKAKLAEVVGSILVANNDETGTDIIINYFSSLAFGQEKLNSLQGIAFALNRTKSLDNLKKGVQALIDFRNSIPENYKEQFGPIVPNILQQLQQAKTAAGLKDHADYLKTVAGELKPF